MSATFNWAYKPSITNKYGLVIPAGADDARPTGYCYVALFGNDITGNGSRVKPYKTLTKGISLGAVTLIVGSGTYREAGVLTPSTNIIIVGDGDVVIDFSYNTYFMAQAGLGHTLYNLRLVGNGVTSYWTSLYVNDCSCTDVIFDGCFLGNNPESNFFFTNCIVSNFSSTINFVANSTLMGCTFVNANWISISSSNILRNCIFYTCNLGFTGGPTANLLSYSLFYHCNFVLNNLGNGGALYPSLPAGYTYYSAIAALQAAYNSLYGTNGFAGCIISDPLFNNVTIGDFTLQFSSPAKNLSYFGTYVGARSIAYAIKARATESAGDFDFSTNTNLVVADNSITFSNSAIDGEICTNVIGNVLSRELAKIPSYGFNADRNGQYIDSIADLDTVSKVVGDTLLVGIPYLVKTAAIGYNGATYQPGDRFTTVTGVTTFTSAGGGVVVEILEAPQRHTIQARFGDGGGVITAGTALVVGNWYYVLTGSVTYDAVVRTAPVVFKAVDTNAFTGSGVVELAMSTESYQHYEPYSRPTSNNVGDARTGAIVRGNGDPAYVRGGIGVNEFPINAKYMQIKYIIKANNLKP